MQRVWSTIFEQWKFNIEASGSILIDNLCLYLWIDQALADVDVDIGIVRLLVDSISAGVRGSKSRNDEALASGFSTCPLLMEDLCSSEGRGDTHSTRARGRLNSWHWLRWG